MTFKKDWNGTFFERKNKKINMKKLIVSLFWAAFCLPLISQNVTEDIILTATMTSSSRLFEHKDDLSSVILIIPRDNQIEIIDSDSSYYKVYFEGDEGYILKTHAKINETPLRTQLTIASQQAPASPNNSLEVNQSQTSRLSYLESRYDKTIAAQLNEGKIWKGMNAGMIRDSWGNPEKIEREISGNTVKEEWTYRNTWLYLENNVLSAWGPIKK